MMRWAVYQLRPLLKMWRMLLLLRWLLPAHAVTALNAALCCDDGTGANAVPVELSSLLLDARHRKCSSSSGLLLSAKKLPTISSIMMSPRVHCTTGVACLAFDELDP